MQDVTIWHNPRCSKSRAALEFLESKDLDINIVKYLETNPSKNELKEILAMLGIAPRALMRTKEDIYNELGLKDENDDEKLIEAMVSHPKLIERPIIIKDNSAVIARPLENINELLS